MIPLHGARRWPSFWFGLLGDNKIFIKKLEEVRALIGCVKTYKKRHCEA